MRILPARRINGRVAVPGDKSISHRTALVAALAEGSSRVDNFATSKDCQSTLQCLKKLGVRIAHDKDSLYIEGSGLIGLRTPTAQLDVGNSGSTIRMLSGILAGQPFTTEITGDASICRRPMRRIVTPLRQMGAQIEVTNSEFAPLRITGGRLTPINYELPVASAQVKSCILFAGLFAEGQTTVCEPAVTRDHTEIMLREFGAEITCVGHSITVTGWPRLQAQHYHVPGDISSAAFLLAATLMLPDSQIVINNVGINPTRSAIIDLVKSLGADVQISEPYIEHGEPIANLQVRHAELCSNTETARLQGDVIANLIDEIPIIAVLATQVKNGLTIRDATELRVKESDRIRTVVDNLRAMGAEVEEYPDGLAVAGPQQLHGAHIDAAGDHRIAMAFAIAGLVAKGETEITGSESVEISFPGFFETLANIVER
ncbi:MAG: 3-phosphoshikimate 1-carboxyvinyltransferase [Acidobacteriota bacterium]